MKRAIFVLILLTVGVTLPPFYGQWAESQRLKQIQTVKQHARTVPGDRLETVLSKLESGEPPSLIVLYTGSTGSHLEPCGCYQEQSGGLPRRAYVVDQLRKRGFPTLLVDAGNIFDGEADIDAKRCAVNLKAMSTMGYDVVALSQADLSYDDAYLSRQRAIATFPFLGRHGTRDDSTQPCLIEEVGEYTLAFVADVACETAVSQADIILSLGTPEDPEHIDVIICPDDHRTNGI